MSDAQIHRIIDVNLNRAGEGLRVLEEAARFVLDDSVLSARFKEMRHQVALRDMCAKLTFLSARDAACDVGENIKTSFQSSARSLLEVTTANARRAEESLRVLEELATAVKLDSQIYATARYQLYTLEKELIGRLSRHNKTQRVRGLYAVIDPAELKEQNLLDIITKILVGGAKLILLRDKTTPKRELLQLACEMQRLCATHEALFIVNDHLDIALASNADGLHVEQSGIPIAEARRFMALDKIIGCSIVTPAEALKAQQDRADYIGCGAAFSAFAQAKCTTIETELVKSTKDVVKLPLVVSIDISLQNIADIINAGADAVAVCSSDIMSALPEKTTRDFVEMFNTCQ